MKYPFGFTVIFQSDDSYFRESGMGLAESYAHAMKKIEEHYEYDLIAVKHLELFAEDTLIYLPEKIIHDYAKTDYGFEGVPCDIYGNIIKEDN